MALDTLLNHSYNGAMTLVQPPITYVFNWLPNHLEVHEALQSLDWLTVTPARLEYYVNDYDEPYTYGSGRGIRTYQPQKRSLTIDRVQQQLMDDSKINTYFEICFLNRYLNQSMSLGYHSDDDPNIDHSKPIAIVSLGVARKIQFRKFLALICGNCGDELPNHKEHPCRWGDLPVKRQQITAYSQVVEQVLAPGSLCLMHAGMQQEWQHAIPKSQAQCGERVSLTFRGRKS